MTPGMASGTVHVPDRETERRVVAEIGNSVISVVVEKWKYGVDRIQICDGGSDIWFQSFSTPTAARDYAKALMIAADQLELLTKIREEHVSY